MFSLQEFEKALSKLIELNLIEEVGDGYKIGNNKKLEDILVANFIPFLISYSVTIAIIQVNLCGLVVD